MRKTLLACSISFLLSAPLTLASELDINRLWLPKSYALHWTSLRAVAESAVATDRCVTLVRGEIARTKSTPEHPVFGITCRDENSRTFLLLYDGLTLASLDVSSGEAKVDYDPSILERPFYEHCLSRWQEELVNMKDLSWLDSIENWRASRIDEFERDGSPGAHFYFERHFDATDIAGAPLEYTAYCDGENIASATTRIAPRAANQPGR
ncbi:hypothetical protein [Simiduia agarivorans]|uniref:TonB-dependent receptor n=1 Tax=Simiduia agarivorans (strain DSM 21679 / JCM 13881 / BCRC 17597 / SA1) TaxID=1117647 RepID=K4KI84_SIMAS|nr:hypothetical protein [Simiduia agarivorans]AFU98859.1 TonB-dependent receptor [Simiduia agarivorans SA1 = DSM 21679]